MCTNAFTGPLPFENGSTFFVLSETSSACSCLRFHAGLQELAHIPVDEGALGVHEIEPHVAKAHFCTLYGCLLVVPYWSLARRNKTIQLSLHSVWEGIKKTIVTLEDFLGRFKSVLGTSRAFQYASRCSIAGPVGDTISNLRVRVT